MKKPDYYKVPLKSRRDIVDFIYEATNQRRYHLPHPFCFNVKVYLVDLDFDTLLKVYREIENDPIFTYNDDWLTAAKERYEENKEHLWNWGVEDARRQLNDTDTYNHLWNGTKVTVEYSFQGRSGGWLSVDKFGIDGEVIDFTNRDLTNECYVKASHGTRKVTWLAGMMLGEFFDDEDTSYKWLRAFYQLITMLKHDLRSEAVESEIQHQAAFNFFVNVCNDIPQPNEIQLKLELADTCG